MQLNLPIVPITDLKVHQNDLIASTQGRSFWILDDLAPIRELKGELSKDSLTVFTPEDAFRVSGRSSLDKVSEEDEENSSTLGGKSIYWCSFLLWFTC